MQPLAVMLALFATFVQPLSLNLSGVRAQDTVQATAEAQRAKPTPLPAEIPLFPLPEVVLFPGVERPLLIYEPRYRDMIADALKGDSVIGTVLLQPGFEANYEGRPPVYAVGCAGVIE